MKLSQKLAEKIAHKNYYVFVFSDKTAATENLKPVLNREEAFLRGEVQQSIVIIVKEEGIVFGDF